MVIFFILFCATRGEATSPVLCTSSSAFPPRNTVPRLFCLLSACSTAGFVSFVWIVWSRPNTRGLMPSGRRTGTRPPSRNFFEGAAGKGKGSNTAAAVCTTLLQRARRVCFLTRAVCKYCCGLLYTSPRTLIIRHSPHIRNKQGLYLPHVFFFFVVSSLRRVFMSFAILDNAESGASFDDDDVNESNLERFFPISHETSLSPWV